MHKHKSLDISNTDSILFNLDEHRRKSCIDRCDMQAAPVIPPPSSATRRGKHHGKGSSDGSSGRAEGSEAPDRRGSKPVIPEVRLSCMETSEDKLDLSSLGGSAQGKEDQDLIDLSSDCTSIPEKHSLLSMSDNDSLVFEPLPPLRIVESDEEFDLTATIASEFNGSPKFSVSPVSGKTLRLSPVVQVSVEDCSRDMTSPDLLTGVGGSACVAEKPTRVTPSASMDFSDQLEDVGQESPMTLKQKRDLLRKTPNILDSSLDDMCEEVKSGIGPGTSPSGRSIFLDIPEDKAEPLSSPEKSKSESNVEEEDGDDEEDDDMGDEVDSDQKPEHADDNDEAEFKIQIVPRQRKQRKIAVSAIQREYLDITFNMFDKLAGEQTTETGKKEGRIKVTLIFNITFRNIVVGNVYVNHLTYNNVH